MPPRAAKAPEMGAMLTIYGQAVCYLVLCMEYRFCAAALYLTRELAAQDTVLIHTPFRCALDLQYLTLVYSTGTELDC